MFGSLLLLLLPMSWLLLLLLLKVLKGIDGEDWFLKIVDFRLRDMITAMNMTIKTIMIAAKELLS